MTMSRSIKENETAVALVSCVLQQAKDRFALVLGYQTLNRQVSTIQPRLWHVFWRMETFRRS